MKNRYILTNFFNQLICQFSSSKQNAETIYFDRIFNDFFLSFSNQDSKCINRQCLHTKAKPMNGNILFCCCTGNLCNAKFEWVPEEHKDVIPAKDHPDFPTEKKSGQSSVMIIVLICFVVAFVALVVAFFVYKFKQQKDETFEAIPTA